ncbi:MAG: hypothetical protein Q9187_006923 [Circinaria calcarea]
MLCEKCVPMFQSSAWADHHPDLTSFTNAAASGCYICEPLLQYALKKSGALEKCIVKPYKYRVYRSEAGTQIIVDMIMLKDGKETKDCRAFLAIPSPKLTTDFSIRNRISAIPLLDASRTAQRWMSDCLNGHEQCQKNTQPRSYPTRLLELGESTIRVILPAEEKLSGPYATLSYCWGPNPTFLRLTVSNLQELQLGIPCSDIPIAFREAIHFIKCLSIRYLWIDALCVIQSGPGSTKDWRSECNKMQDVYSNCIVNLSLSRAAHPNESCLGGCTPNATLPFEVETTGIVGDGESEKCTCTILSWDYFREAIYDQPLGFRAWALQERLLSVRVLSFGLGELFWDCVQVPNACESFPYGLENLSDLFRLSDKAIPNSSDGGKLRSVWWRILEEYVDRELTYPEADKLVALSGIASRMESAMDDVYIAGHFWRTLPYSLNWQVQPPLAAEKRREKIPRRINGPAKKNKDESQNKTPSWSWASMDGPLFVDTGRYNSLADAEAYTLALVDERNLTGQIVSASLKIRAYYAEIEWTQGRPVILGQPRTWFDDIYFFQVNIDDPDDRLAEGTRCWLAALGEDHWLGKWEGLVLKEVEIEGIASQALLEK